METDQMNQEVPPLLGIGRRSFLKQAAMAAVIVPIIGLFGQRAVAEAGAQTTQNPPFGSATPSLRAYEDDFMPMLDSILKALYDGQVRSNVANRLVHSLLDALIAAGDKSRSSPSGAIQAFVGQVRLARRQRFQPG
jgi:hypothetical protein